MLSPRSLRRQKLSPNSTSSDCCARCDTNPFDDKIHIQCRRRPLSRPSHSARPARTSSCSQPLLSVRSPLTKKSPLDKECAPLSMLTSIHGMGRCEQQKKLKSEIGESSSAGTFDSIRKNHLSPLLREAIKSALGACQECIPIFLQSAPAVHAMVTDFERHLPRVDQLWQTDHAMCAQCAHYVQALVQGVFSGEYYLTPVSPVVHLPVNFQALQLQGHSQVERKRQLDWPAAFVPFLPRLRLLLSQWNSLQSAMQVSHIFKLAAGLGARVLRWSSGDVQRFGRLFCVDNGLPEPNCPDEVWYQFFRECEGGGRTSLDFSEAVSFAHRLLEMIWTIVACRSTSRNLMKPRSRSRARSSEPFSNCKTRRSYHAESACVVSPAPQFASSQHPENQLTVVHVVMAPVSDQVCHAYPSNVELDFHISQCASFQSTVEEFIDKTNQFILKRAARSVRNVAHVPNEFEFVHPRSSCQSIGHRPQAHSGILHPSVSSQTVAPGNKTCNDVVARSSSLWDTQTQQRQFRQSRVVGRSNACPTFEASRDVSQPIDTSVTSASRKDSKLLNSETYQIVRLPPPPNEDHEHGCQIDDVVQNGRVCVVAHMLDKMGRRTLDVAAQLECGCVDHGTASSHGLLDTRASEIAVPVSQCVEKDTDQALKHSQGLQSCYSLDRVRRPEAVVATKRPSAKQIEDVYCRSDVQESVILSDLRGIVELDRSPQVYTQAHEVGRETSVVEVRSMDCTGMDADLLKLVGIKSSISQAHISDESEANHVSKESGDVELSPGLCNLLNSSQISSRVAVGFASKHTISCAAPKTPEPHCRAAHVAVSPSYCMVARRTARAYPRWRRRAQQCQADGLERDVILGDVSSELAPRRPLLNLMTSSSSSSDKQPDRITRFEQQSVKIPLDIGGAQALQEYSLSDQSSAFAYDESVPTTILIVQNGSLTHACHDSITNSLDEDSKLMDLPTRPLEKLEIETLRCLNEAMDVTDIFSSEAPTGADCLANSLEIKTLAYETALCERLLSDARLEFDRHITHCTQFRQTWEELEEQTSLQIRKLMGGITTFNPTAAAKSAFDSDLKCEASESTNDFEHDRQGVVELHEFDGTNIVIEDEKDQLFAEPGGSVLQLRLQQQPVESFAIYTPVNTSEIDAKANTENLPVCATTIVDPAEWFAIDTPPQGTKSAIAENMISKGARDEDAPFLGNLLCRLRELEDEVDRIQHEELKPAHKSLRRLFNDESSDEASLANGSTPCRSSKARPLSSTPSPKAMYRSRDSSRTASIKQALDEVTLV